MAFASRQAKLAPIPGRGAYCIQGSVYHSLGGLYPNETQTPQYAQLYILDADESLKQRMGMIYNIDCLEAIMTRLDEWLKAHNPYSFGFIQMHEKLVEQEQESERLGIPFVQPKIYMCHKQNEDPRRYNDPVKTSKRLTLGPGCLQLFHCSIW